MVPPVEQEPIVQNEAPEQKVEEEKEAEASQNPLSTDDANKGAGESEINLKAPATNGTIETPV